MCVVLIKLIPVDNGVNLEKKRLRKLNSQNTLPEISKAKAECENTQIFCA